MNGQIHVYAGPSIPARRVRELLPGAVVHGPVAAGSLLRARLARGDLVGIVDGVFLQSASVRHKEILHLLQEGVEVWGAGSMGALRAAELYPFGMRGIGLVFQLYAFAILERDDEVAVVHAAADGAYRQLSDALVSIRVAARRARRAGVIDRDTERRLVETGASVPFRLRDRKTVVRLAIESGAHAESCEAFLQVFAEPAADVKRQDAERMLRILARQRARTQRSAPRRHRSATTVHLRRWLERASAEQVADHLVYDAAVLSFCQTFAEDYPDFHRRLCLRAIAATNGDSGPAITSDELVDQVISAARAKGLLPPSHDAPPAWLEGWLAPDERTLSFSDAVARALARSFRHTPGIAPTGMALSALRGMSAFHLAQRRVAAIQALNASLARRSVRYTPDRLSDTRVLTVVADRWGVKPEDEIFELSAFDRGFLSLKQLVNRTKDFAPYAILEGIPTFSLNADTAPGAAYDHDTIIGPGYPSTT